MIHQFKYLNSYIVLDVNSGSVHLVDKIASDILALYDSCSINEIVEKLQHLYAENEIREACREIEQLKKDGKLFTEDIFHSTQDVLQHKKTVVKALCLHIAHDCNLKCRYCFAGEGEYHGSRSLMSLAVGQQAIDFIIENSGERRNLEIDFFGGEPTLNFEVVKGIVTYAREKEKKHNKSFRFTLTTNGVLLSEQIMAFANKYMDNVVLSLDGRKEVNDQMRPAYGGKGSYDIVLPRFLEFVKRRKEKSYYIRGTFTSQNLDFSEDVFHLADLGFRQISVEPVVSGAENDYAISEQDLNAIFAQYDKITEEILNQKHGKGQHQPFQFFHFNIDLEHGSCAVKRATGCGAGCEYLSVTPEGELYPCHQFTGLEGFKLGNVLDGIDNKPVVEQFNQVNVYAKPECKECWAKFFCSGGCAANAYTQKGSILAYDAVGCQMQKKRIECALYLQVASSLL